MEQNFEWMSETRSIIDSETYADYMWYMLSYTRNTEKVEVYISHPHL